MGFLFILVLALTVSSCSRTSPSNYEGRGFIQIKGSDTMVNALQRVAEEFMNEESYIYVAVTGGGSGVGIASLINKTCDIAASSREIKEKEINLAHKSGVSPEVFIVAYDGIAIVVHKNNPVSRLTINELHDIYTGKIKNWKEVGGADLSIISLSREVNSGTHIYFKEEVIHLGDKNNKEEFTPDTLLLSSSQAIVEEVSQNESAIGYFGMGYISDRVKVLEISKDGGYFYPDIENVLSKKYPLSRPLYLYTNGKPEGIIKRFIDFTFSKKGQEQFRNTGFVPVMTE